MIETRHLRNPGSLYSCAVAFEMQQSSFSTLDSAGPVRSPLDMNQLRTYLLSSISLGIANPHASGESVTVQQFAHGQSNPTYLVTIDSSGNGSSDHHRLEGSIGISSGSGSGSMTLEDPGVSGSRGRSRRRLRMVLRKKPAGHILASAHAVEREYAVISALYRACSAAAAEAVRCDVGGGRDVAAATAAAGVPVPRPVALCEDVSVLGTPFYLMEFAEGTVYLVRLAPLSRPICSMDLPKVQ